MFEVDPNLWLQSFATPWLTWLMQAVSLFGQAWFYAAMVLVLGFGLRLRPMLGVMLALLLAGLGTHAIKNGLGLPRPVQVDARVLDKGEANQQWLTARGSAQTAFGLPSEQAIAAARALPDPDFGFISGHVSAATAFCASLLLTFASLRRMFTDDEPHVGLLSAGQGATFDSITAVMSLLEGHADVMMDRAAPGLVPQVDLLRRSMEARRDAPGLVQLIFRVLGLTAKREQYRDGARFCRAVLDAAGVDALNLAFAAPDLLPDPAELHDPDRWLRRVPARVG